jgi:hypothetical protein
MVKTSIRQSSRRSTKRRLSKCSSKKCYSWLSLGLVKKFEKYAKERGVSKVARGETKSTQTDMGFMQAYKKMGGKRMKMYNYPVKRSRPDGQTWGQRRDAFCVRHGAQMKKNNRKSYETSGKYEGLPTRQHTGMIMWACSPDSSKLSSVARKL